MDTDRFGKIVVGFDGSEEATAALLGAVALADGVDAPVDVVTSWRWPVTLSALPVGSSWSPLHDAEEIRQQANDLLASSGPHRAAVTTREAEGGAAEVLLAAAADAGLLVVGSRGRGGFRGLLLGSVSTACMQHAPCPVLVHRGAPRPDPGGARTIVVGVDGSPESGRALRFAVTTARRLGYRVRVVTTWKWPAALKRDEAGFEHWSPEDDARATASSAVDAAEDLLDDDVEVTSELVEGSPAEVLVDASRDAALLVLGNRGLGGFRGLLVGSVSQECAQHAYCPVVVHRS